MDMNQLIQQVSDQVMERLTQNRPIYYVIGSHLTKVESYLLQQGMTVKKELPALEEAVQEHFIVVEISSLKSLIRIANLIAVNQLEDLVVESLLTGRPLFVQLTAEVPINSHLVSKINAAKRELIKMGARLIKENNLEYYFPPFGKSCRAPFEQTRCSKNGTSKKQLISLKVLKDNYPLDELTTFDLSPNMILTALARDYLRENNIQIVKE
ncbi:hypothetical protein D822_03614 [Streptococcus ratti FA-1 = DSM 20564]|uniref:Ethanolamine utilization protein n=2 Tax=Streptococcus ratti TaxID=1341 RepID=A0ABN0GTJ0_STRRT|nr:hypothetical protein SRA_04301 [Streptococcus ratti FA-1 = DSM 20564]EMP70633.1 hypothetical protein D822_03614 [Streptococcus ratti FA-1 = DSM 20564]QEY07584.1 hypothetical protein FY406_08015 [Streptococcus ratti]VEI60041.1 ethanolamine utilization protein [Streptococcus mutans]